MDEIQGYKLVSARGGKCIELHLKSGKKPQLNLDQFKKAASLGEIGGHLKSLATIAIASDMQPYNRYG